MIRKAILPFLVLLFFVHANCTLPVRAERGIYRDEIAEALKEALVKGITSGSSKASALDGYLKNPLIKIPFPEDAKFVEKKLREVGLGKEVDKFVVSLNRGAEDAAKEALPIFLKAIKSISIKDAIGILRGGDGAATAYLKSSTSNDLINAFKPVMTTSLGKVGATKYYSKLVTQYNRIPMVQKVNPDLSQYATQKAVDGLFVLVAQEENEIRKNPIARTTDLLKRVFGNN